MDDQTYYLRRVRQEDEAARAATCREARDRHDELASAYRFRAHLLISCPADAPSSSRDRPLASTLELKR